MATGSTQPQEDQPSAEPILRLNTSTHTAPIRRIATDRENRYAVTASNDKTARVWLLPDGRLATLLRVPIGDGNMGNLNAVAMTPDGATVALGGWTSVSGTRENIYLFDRASGTLLRRLSGLPNVVIHLAYSADGSVLAATLGSNGIRVYNTRGAYEQLPSDAAYGADSYWADFDPQGRLVTTSFDGFVRLYAAGRYDVPLAKVKGRGGGRPYSAVFSPDSERVAVGYNDSTAVDLLSGRDLAFLNAADTSGVNARSLHATGWSVDGSYLLAAGIAGSGKGGQIRRWANGGRGRHIDIVPSHNTVMGLLPLKDGGTLFAAQDPAFGVIDAQGHAKVLQGPGQLNFRVVLGTLRVSKEGKTVEQGTDFPKH